MLSAGGELLCVAAVTPIKGHDLLVAALATLRDLTWRCTCAGPLAPDPDFVERDLASREDDIPDTLAVHPGEAGPSFGAPIVLSASTHLDLSAESPFVRVGAANGAIVVNVGSGPYAIDGSAVGPPTFQMLECAP